MPRAAVIPAPSAPIEVRDFPEPEPETGGVVLDTLVSEVCGTDVHLWHGRLSGVPYPLIPGHVSVGVVARTGGPVTDVDGVPVRPGETVTFLDVHGTCHRCWTCLVARTPTRCPSRRVYGITYGADDGLCGGWSDRIALKPGTLLLRLDPRVTPERWIAAGCGLPTALHAIDLAQIRLGDRVLVQGAGPVGLAACALAAASGAAWVGVVDGVEARRTAAGRMGADQAFALGPDMTDNVRRATGGRGADVVIEASGSPDAVAQGCALARDGGRYVIVGQYTDNGDVTLNPHHDINRKHLSIQGCWGVEYHHFRRGMEILGRLGDRFAWEASVSARYGLDDAGRALEDVEARRVVKALIVP